MEHDRYFEDHRAGETLTSASAEITEAAIVDFARQFDPQAFHLDHDAAAAGPFGGLTASGFHTIGLCFRLYCETAGFGGASLGSPGMEAIKWLRPVRPGDRLRAQFTYLEVRASASKPDRGFVRVQLVGLNQDDDAVLSMIFTHILKRRQP